MAKSFVFNNGWNQSGGLTHALTRAYATVGDDGETVAADGKRFTRAQRLLCGTPDVVQRADGADNNADNYYNHQMYALAGGFAHDSSTPLFLQIDATHAFMMLRKTDFGSSNVLNSWYFAGYADTDAKRGQIDLLKGSSFEETGYIYDPNPGFASYTICHGLVVAICQQKQDLSPLTFDWTASTPGSGGTFVLTSSNAPSGWDSRQGSDVFLPLSGGGYARVALVSISPGTSVTVQAASSTWPSSNSGALIPRWKSVGTAVCAYQHGYHDWKKIAAYTDTAQSGHLRGSLFQCQGAAILDHDSGTDQVRRAWIPFSDYVPNYGDPTLDSTQANYFLIRFTRTSVSTKWDPDPLVQVLSLDGAAPTHGHPCYVERYATSEHSTGLRLVCPVGDSQGQNYVAAAYRNDESYDQLDHSSSHLGASSTDGASYNGWTTRLNRNGIPTNGSDPTEDGNQFVGSTPLGTFTSPNGHVVGADEMAIPLAYLPQYTSSDTTGLFDFTRVYGQPSASCNRDKDNIYFNWQVFTMTCQYPDYGWQHAALLTPGNSMTLNEDGGVGSSQLDLAASRLLFSPTGEVWGECYAPREAFNSIAIFGD